jgi:hypothetical protein
VLNAEVLARLGKLKPVKPAVSVAPAAVLV